MATFCLVWLWQARPIYPELALSFPHLYQPSYHWTHSPAPHILSIHAEISSLFSSHTFSSWIASTSLLRSSSCQTFLPEHACLMLTYGYCRLSIHLGYFCSIIFFLWDSNIYICSKWEDSHYFWVPVLTWMHLLEAALQLNPTKISVYLMIKYLWQWDNKCFETIAKLNLGRWAEECKAMQNKIRKKPPTFDISREQKCVPWLYTSFTNGCYLGVGTIA